MEQYESRIGRILRDKEVIFQFITDMRNFRQFLPEAKVEDWEATQDSCSFVVSPVGKVSLKIVESQEYTVVKYGGDGLNNTTFFLWVQMKEAEPRDVRIKVTIKVDLNPILRMMASGPLNDFLEKLVSGMESFDGWETVSE